MRKLNEAGVLAGLRSTNIVIVDPARTTALPVRPNYPLNLGLGLAGGLLAGTCIAFAREAVDNSIRTPEQVETIASLPVLGVVPDLESDRRWLTKDPGTPSWKRVLPPRGARAIDCTILKYPTSRLAESFRALRTSLLFSNSGVAPKILLVTSALPQEGKTSASLNLALALAQQGTKVLLMDADLRRPNLHTRLGIPLSPGLDDLLAATVDRKLEPVPHSKVPNLFVLPAGVRHPQPAELLGLKKMREILEGFRERFDFVIIDSPPVLSVTDAAILSQHADGVMLVIRAARTTEQSLLRARDVLAGVNARVTGVLVNRFNISSPDHYAYYGYNGCKHGEAYGANNSTGIKAGRIAADLCLYSRCRCAGSATGEDRRAAIAACGPHPYRSRRPVGPAVFDVPELAQSIRISDTGDAALMLLGSVHLAGLTAPAAQALIEDGLRKGNFILDPHVSVLIREYGTQGVSVLGEVRKPGVYQVLGTRTLLDIISEAGGTTSFAAHEATIKRRAGDQTLTASLANDPAELLAAVVELHPGDTVIVPKAGIVYVIGDVGRPGGYVMQNSGNISLIQAIALAQGVNRTAALSHTRIIRKGASGYSETAIDLKRVLAGRKADLPLAAEDIVYVPPSTPKMLLWRGPSVVQSAASAAVYQAVP